MPVRINKTMCGLIYARNTATDRTGRAIYHSVSKRIMKQYYNQKERGIEGFGVYDGEHQHLIKETTERRMIKWLRGHKSSEILFHHRIPTSTDNVKNAAHPFSTKDFFGDTEYIFIHNGIIDNSPFLKKYQQWKFPGIKYTSEQPDGRFNDSEALMWDIALSLEGKGQDKPKARGSVAFICIEKHKDDPNKNQLHYFRNEGSPLYKCGGKKMEVIVSKPAKDQKKEEIEPDKLFSFNYSTRVTTAQAFDLPVFVYKSAQEAEMIKAIPANVMNDQPETNPYLPVTPVTPISKLDQAKEFVRATIDLNKPMLDYKYEALKEENNEDQSLESDYLEQSRFYDDLKELRADVNAVSMEYLNDVDGHYYAAIENMKDRLMQCHKLPYSIENWKEIMLLEGGIAVLVQDPFWNAKDPNAQAHAWMDSPTEEDEIQTTLPFKEQSPVEKVVSKVRKTAEEVRQEEQELYDLQEQFFTPVNTDTPSEILDSSKDVGHTSDGPIMISEVLPSRLARLFGKKHGVEEVPSLITEIPREELT